MTDTAFTLERDGVTLAGRQMQGHGPTVVFLPGLRSDMTGDKAEAVAAFCAARGQAMLRLDYAGHGASGGRFEDGTLGGWAADARHVIESRTQGGLLLIGSSMGGWIGLLTALALRGRVVGFIGVAAAPDFTERLMWAAMLPAERDRLRCDGVVHAPSEYGEPLPITLALIEDGRRHLLLEAPIALDCPVVLLHGQRDPDVPWETALHIADRLSGREVRVVLVKDGDHRLSRPQDLRLLTGALADLLGEDGGEALAKGGMPPGET